MTQTILTFSTMTDAQVKEILAKHSIGLTIDEARKVEKLLGRPPTLVEATIWGIQGSEHCSYKSSRRFLNQFVTDGKHVILGPKEDSGIIAITDGPKGKRWGIVVSHESHNHPSQIVPFEGAATGVGGCVRDVVCMGARVLGNLDSLRLGDLNSNETKAIASEVVRGIAAYGNALGIPNLGGDTVFDRAYNANCLVNVVSVGLVREDEIIHSYVQKESGKAGYDVIVVGKPTDYSGFGGASFASLTMQEEDAQKNAGAVQEPNPFLERHLLASTYELFDWLAREKKLDKVSFKDLGAGGNVCASVEQVAPLGKGAMIDLEKIHRAIPDLPPEVIACAETQERFCWICHPDLTAHILRHYNEVWDLSAIADCARASVIGTVTEDDTYTLTYKGETVCSAPSTLLTSGLQYTRPTMAPTFTFTEPKVECEGDRITVNGKSFTIAQVFEAMLSHPSHASKAPIYKHYDKNIIGNSVIEAGEADASVIAPLSDLASYVTEGNHPDWKISHADANVGVALSSGGNGRYGRISPYLQGVNAVVETMRNVAAVGALPRAITDCLNYGNPEIPEHLWALEQGVRGIADAAKGVTIDGGPVPVISGNVSLYNATKEDSIDPTANVCCIGVMPDASKATTMQLKKIDSSLYFLGSRKNECGGSAYYDILETLAKTGRNALLGKNVPDPNFASVKNEIECLHEAISQGLILSAHDVSEGGLLLALFEMTLSQRKKGGTIGVSIDIAPIANGLRNDATLFSETGGFIMETPAKSGKKLEALATQHGCQLSKIGVTSSKVNFSIYNGSAELLFSSLTVLRSQWESTNKFVLGL